MKIFFELTIFISFHVSYEVFHYDFVSDALIFIAERVFFIIGS